MKAKNREQYVEAWQSHVKDLISPFIDAERPIDDYRKAKAELFAVIEEAADKAFPEEAA